MFTRENPHSFALDIDAIVCYQCEDLKLQKHLNDWTPSRFRSMVRPSRCLFLCDHFFLISGLTGLVFFTQIPLYSLWTSEGSTSVWDIRGGTYGPRGVNVAHLQSAKCIMNKCSFATCVTRPAEADPLLLYLK